MTGEPLEAADLGWHGLDGGDPGSARPAAEVLKAVARVRSSKAGVYGTGTSGDSRN